jgi:Rad3-related DNA helicase
MNWEDRTITRLQGEVKEKDADILHLVRLQRDSEEISQERSERLNRTHEENDALLIKNRDLEAEIERRDLRRRELEDENWTLRRGDGDFERRQKAQSWDSLQEALLEMRKAGVTIDPTTIKPFMLRTGKIPTIRIVRMITGLGLKESKDIVDQWIAKGEA